MSSRRSSTRATKTAAEQNLGKKTAKENSSANVASKSQETEPELTYELIRQRNIENRERLFNELQIGKLAQVRLFLIV